MKTITLKILKKYDKAVRVETLKGFKINLPVCEFVDVRSRFAIVDKEFFLEKKNEAVKNFEDFNKQKSKPTYEQYKRLEKRLKSLNIFWTNSVYDKEARAKYKAEAEDIKKILKLGYKKH